MMFRDLAIVLLLSVSSAASDSVCDVQDVTDTGGNACLLQASVGSVGSVASVDSMVSIASVSPHYHHNKVSFEELEEPRDLISLREIDAERSESEVVREMLRTSESRCQSYKAHAMFLRRHSAGLKDSHKAVNTSMDDLVGKFINAQAGSQDACHSQLLEAKHQLNQLHQVVSDLIAQVNSTETTIAIYDKELQGKLKELEDLEKDRTEKLKACKAKKDADTAHFKQLSEEMDEMAQIASPTVTMDVKDGTIHTVSLVQEHNYLIASMPDPDADANAYGGKTDEPDDVNKMHANVNAGAMANMNDRVGEASSDLPQLIQATKNAASEFLTCMKQSSSAQSSLLQASLMASPAANSDEANNDEKGAEEAPTTTVAPDAKDKEPGNMDNADNAGDNMGNNFPDADNMGGDEAPAAAKPKSESECLAEKDKLEKTYVKAYIELARLKTEYDTLANSTACEDAAETEYSDRKVPLQDASDKLASQISKKVQDLQGLRPRLEQAKDAEKALRKYVETMTEQCGQLEPAISDLNKVRDAIRALSACPGLSRVQFSVPKWTGTWVSFNQHAAGQTDADQDAAMNAACNAASEGSRAAEVGEIAERIIEAMPDTNTAPEPLLGACPMCAGDADASYKSGHARVCWAQGDSLTLADKSSICSDGAKSILCVVDRSSLGDSAEGASLLMVSDDGNTEILEGVQRFNEWGH